MLGNTNALLTGCLWVGETGAATFTGDEGTVATTDLGDNEEEVTSLADVADNGALIDEVGDEGVVRLPDTDDDNDAGDTSPIEEAEDGNGTCEGERGLDIFGERGGIITVGDDGEIDFEALVLITLGTLAIDNCTGLVAS